MTKRRDAGDVVHSRGGGVGVPNPGYPWWLTVAVLTGAFAADAFSVIDLVQVREAYQGTHAQRIALRESTSFLIERYINAVDLGTRKEPVRIDEGHRAEVDILKQLTWHYVIENPASVQARVASHAPRIRS